MRILVLTPFLPYAGAPAGSPRAVYSRLRLLAPGHELTVVSFLLPEEQDRVLDLTSLGVAVYTIDRATGPGNSVPVLAKRLRLMLGLLLLDLPLLALEFKSRRMQKLVSGLLAQERYDAVLVEHVLMAQYLPEGASPRGQAVLLSDHDPRAAFEARPLISPAFAKIYRSDRGRWLRYLRRSWEGASLVAVPSEPDTEFVRRLAPRARVEALPFGLYMPAVPADDAPREPGTLLFVGNFSHPPNVDAALRLVQTIFPQVRGQCPGARLLLVGSGPPPELLAAAGEGVEVTGAVPSVEPYLRRSTLFVAPLARGGGVRVKLLEAMAWGVPVVTTSLGAQGLDAEAGRHLLVADSTASFVSAVLGALDNSDLRAQLAREARSLVLSPEADGRRLRQVEAAMRRAALRHKGEGAP